MLPSRLVQVALGISIALSACGPSVDDGGTAAALSTSVGSTARETPAQAVETQSTLAVSPTVSVTDASAISTTAASTTTASITATSSPPTSSSTSTSSPSTVSRVSTTEPSGTTSTIAGQDPSAADQVVPLRFESRVGDVSTEAFAAQALAILNDERGWVGAGFRFVSDPTGPYRVILAEGPEVDELCLPLETFSKVSCQNGPVVALNADRWRHAVDHWELGVDVYRGYLVNHEVGHLIGQRHPKPRCPVAGRPAGVMEQQTAGLEGCVGNPWPRSWELDHARQRPVVYGPLPDWGPDPVPRNGEADS